MIFQGKLRLSSSDDYKPLAQFLKDFAAEIDSDKTVSLDIRELQHMNSSGINCLCQFLMHSQNEIKQPLDIKESKDVQWQNRMLKNIQRVIPSIGLEFS